MKKTIITAIIVTTLILIGIFTWIYTTSFHTIYFLIEQDNSKVEIYNKNNNLINSSTLNKFSLSLQDGDYYYKVIGDRFDLVNYPFNINKSSKNIDMKPNYSSSYLSLLLTNENNNIMGLLKDTYPKIINNYNISKGQLFNRGEWFGAVVKKKIDPRDITDTYRVVFHKLNNKWLMVRYPEIVLTKYNYPDVPIDILNTVNNLKD